MSRLMGSILNIGLSNFLLKWVIISRYKEGILQSTSACVESLVRSSSLHSGRGHFGLSIFFILNNLFLDRFVLDKISYCRDFIFAGMGILVSARHVDWNISLSFSARMLSLILVSKAGETLGKECLWVNLRALVRILALPVLLSLVPMVSFFENPCLGCRKNVVLSLILLLRIFIMFCRFLDRLAMTGDSEDMSPDLVFLEYWNNEPIDCSFSC